MSLKFSTPSTVALPMPAKDTEYSFVIPLAATRVLFQPRADADIQLSTVEGGSGDPALYVTVSKRSVGNGPLEWHSMAFRQDRTVYVQSGIDNNALEVTLFQ